MAQGRGIAREGNKRAAAASKIKRQARLTRPGNRTVKPKKAAAVQAARIQSRLTKAHVKNAEQVIGAKVVAPSGRSALTMVKIGPE